MTLRRCWDAFDAYLFDIDGTLLHCSDAVHYFAFCEALSSVAGRPMNLDGVTAHGNTDLGILRDAFAHAAISEECWRPKLPAMRQTMCRYVEDNRAQLCVDVLPSVREVLHHLRARGATVCVATGNLERIGKQKLLAANLLDLFHDGFWSDEFEDRAQTFRHALAQLRARMNCSGSVLFLGDTPADIRAAHANGAPVIAVATGTYSSETLQAEKPSLCLQSFADLFDVRGSD